MGAAVEARLALRQVAFFLLLEFKTEVGFFRGANFSIPRSFLSLKKKMPPFPETSSYWAQSATVWPHRGKYWSEEYLLQIILMVFFFNCRGPQYSFDCWQSDLWDASVRSLLRPVCDDYRLCILQGQLLGQLGMKAGEGLGGPSVFQPSTVQFLFKNTENRSLEKNKHSCPHLHTPFAFKLCSLNLSSCVIGLFHS